MTIEHFDVLIVGAGLSGIGAGYHLQTRSPGRTYAILEGRDAIGGTWDLFRYPGIRSDSDMYTLGYAFRPWEESKAIADGPSILRYVRDTAREYGIDRRIRFGHRVKRASWSSQDACWSVEAERGGAQQPVRFTCNFLFVCGGYYKYSGGYTPDFPGVERFAGRVVHPQKWTDDIDYAGKRVIVIGSGATAVTLVPELAKQAAHVTMLQRSPTWVVARPAEDAAANRLRRWLPSMLAYRINRWKRVLLQQYFFNLCRRDPARARRLILGGVRAHLGPDYDVARHFTPRYNPWEQRAVPGARRGPVPRHPAREGVGGHRPHRDLYRKRHQARLGHGARGRPDRHRHGLEPGSARRHPARRRRRARRSGARPSTTRA